MSPAFGSGLRTFGVAFVAIAAYILPTFAWDQALFGNARLLPLFNVSSAVAVADLDRDGRLDVAAITQPGNATKNGTALSWALAAEGIQHSFPLGNASAGRPQLADFDLDGYPDAALVVDGALVVFAGNKSGFRPVVHDRELPLLQLLVADINADGVPDAITRAADRPDPRQPGMVLPDATDVRLGRGNFTFSGPLSTGLPGKGAVAAADFNRDGHLDVVLATGFSLEAALGDGDGTFHSPSSNKTPFVPSHELVLAADVDRDGRPDVLTAGKGGVFLSRGRGDGTFGVPIVALDVGGVVQSLDVGDVDRDGDLDLLFTWTDGFRERLEISEGFGDGTFGAAELAIPKDDSSVNGVLVDLNQDGLLDIVAAQPQQGVVAPGLPTLSDYHALLKQNDALEMLVEKLEAQVSGLSAEVDNANEKLANASATIATLRHEVSTLDATVVELETKIEALEGEKTRLLLQVADLERQLIIAKLQVDSLSKVVFGGDPDRAAAEALYAEAAQLITALKTALPGEKKLADAEAALQRAQAALIAGDYELAAREAEKAYDIASSIADKNGFSSNGTPDAPAPVTKPKT